MTTTLATRKQSEAIRSRMQAIRNELPYDADAARARVQELADWKYHMRKHPLPILVAAATVGYLLVPAKRAERLSQSSGNGSGSSVPPAPKKSMIGGVVGALVTLAVRQGTTIATRKLSDAFLSGSTSRQSIRPSQETTEVHHS